MEHSRMAEMTSKDRTVAALEHRPPDQVPAFLMAMDDWGEYVKSVGAADGNELLLRWGVGVDRAPTG